MDLAIIFNSIDNELLMKNLKENYRFVKHTHNGEEELFISTNKLTHFSNDFKIKKVMEEWNEDLILITEKDRYRFSSKIV